jgi:hypothetical protein
LSAHPAERISNVPSVKIPTTIHEGAPDEASQSAVNVGHSSSKVPIGLSRRINRS